MCLTFAGAVLVPLPQQTANVGHFLVNTTMLQAYVKVPSVEGVYWSLACELGFYFAIWSLFVLGLLKRIYWVLWISLAGGLLFHFYPRLIPHPLQYLFVVNTYCQLFVAGIAFYKWHAEGLSWPLGLLLAASLALNYVVFGMTDGAIVTGFYVLFGLAVTGRIARVAIRPLVFFGTISYSLYLIHEYLGWRLMNELYKIGLGQVPVVALALCAAIVLATLMTWVVERLVQAWLRRLYKSYKGSKPVFGTVADSKAAD